MLKIVEDPAVPNSAAGSVLDEIVRDGARQMLAAALLAEVAAHVEALRGEVDADGHRLVVRNGFHEPREVSTAAGAVPVRQPRVNDKRIDEVTGERKRFSSAILPAWSRKSPRVAEVLPLLYLHGLSSSDFGPALEQFLGSDAGLSAGTITRLTAQWQDEARAFNSRSLAGSDYVYCWVGLCVLLGRRHPPEGAARAGQGVPAGGHRCSRRRPQGAGRVGRRVPRVGRVVG
jgi:putative transposase